MISYKKSYLSATTMSHKTIKLRPKIIFSEVLDPYWQNAGHICNLKAPSKVKKKFCPKLWQYIYQKMRIEKCKPGKETIS